MIRRAAALLALMVASTRCSHLAYHPTDLMYVDHPETLNRVREELVFPSLDGTKLSAWHFKARMGKPMGTVLQFHGNAQNMTSHFASLYWLGDEGYDLMTFDYRGYGVSEGSPSQEGTHKDALAAIRYLLQRSPRITLYGQSLGGAILMRAVADLAPDERKRIHAVVIEGSFDNYKSVAASVLSSSWVTWLFQPLAYALVSNEYGPGDSIGRISPLPLLIVHGDDDQTIPLKFGKRIFDAAKPPKEMLVIPGGRHINAWVVDGGKHRPKLLEFLERAGAPHS